MFGKKIDIEVDARKIIGKLNRNWRYIGYDECNYTQTPEGINLIGHFGALEERPYYIRMHHLFCTGNCLGAPKWGSTNIYSEDAEGNPVYHWEVLDEINDIILDNHCKPFFELGFLPMDMVDPVHFDGMEEWEKYNAYKTRFWAYPPKDYDKWYDLIYNLIRHCVDKYGQDEVTQWYWELWNEPDILYWKGTMEEYCKLYDYTEAAVHAVLPDARLGGPSTTSPLPGNNGQKFLEEFLIHCKRGQNYFSNRIGTRLDFVTFHVKGGAFSFKLNDRKAFPSTQYFAEQVKCGLETIRKNGFDKLEVVLSEADPDGWAAGGIYDNPNFNFRNTEYYPSFVAASYHIIRRIATDMNMDVRPLAWAFLFVSERCFEGTRTFATQGILKPIFNLFRIYAKLGNEVLSLKSSGELIASLPNKIEGSLISGIATVSEDNSIQIMIFNHHDDWENKNENEVEIKVENLNPETFLKLTHYRVDENHSNAYLEWVKQGKPRYPSKDQYETIKSQDKLKIIETITLQTNQDGTLNIHFNMPVHAISLILLEKQD